jgi:hypothetical protein
MLNIVYRFCDLEIDGNIRNIRPPWYSKLNCLKSFLNSVKQCRDHIDNLIFLYDGTGGPQSDIIPKEFEIIKIYERSNIGSLRKQIDIASQLGGNIYFVEDDYLHLPDSIKKIDLALPNLKLINGYDHLDRYTRTDDIDYEKKIVFDYASNTHWRTAEATWCTYAVESNLYKQIEHVIRGFELSDREMFRFLHRQGVPLFTSIPGLTTQVDMYLSPGIDWESFNKQMDTL